MLTLPVQELSLDSKTAISFPVPHVSDHQDVGRLDFNIDSQGKVYALLEASNPVGQGQTPKTDYYIAGYSGDGTNNSLVQISGIPDKNAIPLRLAAFLNGNFLLTGNTSIPGQEPKFFAAILASHGTFVTDVHLQSGGSLKSMTGNGLAVGAPDGDVYVLRDTTPPRLAAISPQGQVVHELQVQPPLPHLQPTQLGIAGDNYVFIQFSPVSTAQMSKQSVGKMVEVLDLANGVPFALYRLPLSKSDFGLAACATSPYQFFSLGTAPGGGLELIRYTPPGS
ncbi:MAG TPA: hypothetical protein VGX94_07045 [Terriglobia bacterium]|nr:hypothetical protein [Terriglobia bacterium]